MCVLGNLISNCKNDHMILGDHSCDPLCDHVISHMISNVIHKPLLDIVGVSFFIRAARSWSFSVALVNLVDVNSLHNADAFL